MPKPTPWVKPPRPEKTWYPNPGPQTLALQTTAFEALYGGARGGGKTDAGLAWLLDNDVLLNKNARALVIRRNADDLSDWLDRAARMYEYYGGRVTGNPPVIKFPSGYRIRTGHLRDDMAYTKYMGHEYHRILIEELTQIPDEKRYIQLIASARSTVVGLTPRIFATTNPGGVGHHWVKRRFKIDDVSLWSKKWVDPVDSHTRIYIPAKVEDTPQLTTNDPGYVLFLEGLKETDQELWKAWRNGDWNTFAGQFFKEFNPHLHIIPPFIPRPNLPKVGGMDWGRTAPFVFLGAVLQEVSHDGVKFNRLFVYQEVWGTDKNPKEWATLIDMRVNLEEYDFIMGDPAMWTKGLDNSISISDQFDEAFTKLKTPVAFKPASNDRVGGWSVVHDWLSLAPDGLPYLMFTDNCRKTIETLPSLVHDETRVEDVDLAADNDHLADALRYMVKHVKWINARSGAVKYQDPGANQATFRKRDGTIGIDPRKFSVKSKSKRDWKSI